MLSVKMKNKEKKVKINEKKKDKSVKNFFDNVQNIMTLIIPDAVQETRDYIYLGDSRYSRNFILTVYPNKIYLGWLDDIFNKMGDINISILNECSDEDIVIRQLTHKVTVLQSEYNTFENQGNIRLLPALEESITDFEDMRRKIQTTNDRLFYVTILLRLNAESLDELNEKTAVLKSEFSRISAKIRTLSFRQLEGLKDNLPINNGSIHDYERNMTASGFATMFPISSSGLSSRTGVVIGRNYFTGLPVYLDVFDKELPNPHIAVLGMSGAGKSVFEKILAGRGALLNIKQGILDLEGEYVGLTEKMNGRVIKITQGVPAGINLFDLDIEENNKETGLLNKVAEIRALLSGIMRNYMDRPLNAKELSDVELAVIETYKEIGITRDKNSLYKKEGGKINGKITLEKIKKKMPTLSDFHRILSTKENSSDLANILKPFLSGNSLGMFDCQSTLNAKDLIIDFDLSEINDEVTKFYASLVLTSWITEKFMLSKDNNKKSVVIDEAWHFLKYEETANFLEYLARRARKRNVSLVIGTQNLDEFILSTQGKAVISSCARTLLMKQSSGSVDKICDFFKLSEGTKDFLLKARNRRRNIKFSWKSYCCKY